MVIKLVLAGALLLLMSCAPAPRPSTAPSGETAAQPSAPAQPKTLRLGMTAQYEPNAGLVLFANNGTGAPQINFLLHAGLTVYDAQENLLPWIAASVPSTANGDWVL